MKSKEEIEQLANDFYLKKAEEINNSITKGFIVSASKGGFIQGYTQCQEDSSEVVDDFIKFLHLEMQLGLSDKKTIERIKEYFEKYFMNSLKKQD